MIHLKLNNVDNVFYMICFDVEFSMALWLIVKDMIQEDSVNLIPKNMNDIVAAKYFDLHVLTWMGINHL